VIGALGAVIGAIAGAGNMPFNKPAGKGTVSAHLNSPRNVAKFRTKSSSF